MVSAFNSIHECDEYDARCIRCGSSRIDFEDGYAPTCALLITKVELYRHRFTRWWNNLVRAAARRIMIGCARI